MKLINIIKGDQVQKHFMKCEEGITPYYYDSFESIEESSLKSTYKKNPISIENGRIKFERSERDLNIPFYIEDNDVKEVHNNKNFYKSTLKIYSKKPFFLNNEKIPAGYSNLKFKEFDRAKKETEYCNYKNALIYQKGNSHLPESGIKELFEEITKITDKA